MNIIAAIKESRLYRNLSYLFRNDLYQHEKELIYTLKDEIIEDCAFELEEDKEMITKLSILDEYDSVELILKYPKSFCRFGDGELFLMEGGSQPFQEYDPRLAQRMIDILGNKQDDMYVCINRGYFQSPMDCSPRNRRFYRLNGTKLRRMFIKYCYPDNLYLEARCLCSYYRYDEHSGYDYERHYEKMLKLFEGRKIAIVCGMGILDNLEHDVFCRATEKMILYAPARNAFSEYDDILNRIKESIPLDYTVCIILGMTAKVLVQDLTQLGYMAWDVGHLAKDYNAYMEKKDKTEENMTKFWAPD